MRINRTLLSFSRTIHIYLTLFGLLVLLGFGITGFTANHEDWFGATHPRVTESQAETPMELIEKADALRIVEHLRQALRITSALAGYDDLDDRLSIGFKSPGESWEIEIEKANGRTSVHHEVFNFIAVVNNLHRGRYAGSVWSWVIDLSAGLIVLACATGFILWLALPRRRKLGIASMVVGAVATMAVFAVLVPGSDIKPESKSTATNPVPDTGETTPAPTENLKRK